MESLRGFFDSTPSAAVGEIGLDKGSQGKKIHFGDQVQVFQQQLELAKELEKPASIHCVRAYGDLLDIMKSIGPFPAGVILHSFLGSAEIVPDLTRLGAYFSFSGFLMSMKAQKAKKMLASVPMDRILLETDAPDALPRSNVDQLLWIPDDTSILAEHHDDSSTSDSNHAPTDSSTLSKETLNHPANIVAVLSHVSSLLGISEEELAEVSYRNASRLFSFPGSKIFQED